MNAAFRSRLAGDLDRYLVFKRALGCAYIQSSRALVRFDRYLAEHGPRRGPIPIESLLRAWLGRIEGRKPVTISLELGILRQFLRFRRRSDPDGFVPGKDWGPGPRTSHFVPCVLSIEEVRAVLAAARTLSRPRFRAKTFRVIVLILYCTGLRPGEAARLRDEDVDLRRRAFLIRETKRKTRLVPFGADLAHELAAYRRARDRFPSVGVTFLRHVDGRALTRRAAQSQVGLRRVRVTPHVMRHSCAVALLQAGVDLTVIRDYLGHVSINADPDRAWAAVLAADPRSPYRWDHALSLKAQGERTAYLREAAQYLERKDALPSRRLAHALALIEFGSEGEALASLKRLAGRVSPSRVEDVRRVLALYYRHAEWSAFFALGDSKVGDAPDLHLVLAEGAVKAERRDDLGRHLDAVLAVERPVVSAFELAYRVYRRAQNRAELLSIGARAVALYPEEAIGYLAQGKAAKLIRDDDTMLTFYEKALSKRPDDPDVHYDMGLVYHGRLGCADQAIAHYRDVLRLMPGHPKRTTIEAWIAALSVTAKGSRQ